MAILLTGFVPYCTDIVSQHNGGNKNNNVPRGKCWNSENAMPQIGDFILYLEDWGNQYLLINSMEQELYLDSAIWAWSAENCILEPDPLETAS